MARLRIAKWGNSLALRLPAGFAKQLDLKEGSAVETEIDGNVLLVRAGQEAPQPLSRSELLKGLRILKEKRGSAARDLDLGPPVGKELW